MSALSPENILRTGLGFWASKALLSAVEIGIFSELAKSPAELHVLQQKLGLHPRSARDFLDALVALKLLERDDYYYRNTAETEFFLDRAKVASYVGGLMEIANGRLYRFWGSLTDALRTGQPQSEVKQGGNLFAEVYADPAKLESFLSGMSGISVGPASMIATKFDWRNYRSVMDVGSAQGMVSVTLAQSHPHLDVVGFDLPQVQPVFEKFVVRHGLTDRVRFHAGDFFNEQLPRTDVIIMGHILHDWDLRQKRVLLKKAFDALPKAGALIVYDAIIDDARRENAFGLLMSLNMLIETPGGFDYTGADCQTWMHEVGFEKTRVQHLLGPDSMVIGTK